MSGQWTGEEVKKLRKMWARGDRIAEIAKEFGRSENSVRHARMRLGLQPRNGANIGIGCSAAPKTHRDMFRESDRQAHMWRELLARAVWRSSQHKNSTNHVEAGPRVTTLSAPTASCAVLRIGAVGGTVKPIYPNGLSKS